jgi:hypothetical protein
MRLALLIAAALAGVYSCHPPPAAHAVNLAWYPSTLPVGAPAVTAIKIFRGAVSGGELLLASVPLASLAKCPVSTPTGKQCYSDRTVKAGATYFYYVKSTNVNGDSDPSNQVMALVP